MKRVLVLVLLVPILALTMISCDADMRSNIVGFMDGFGGNVYEDAGLIVVNTAQAEAAAATVAAIGTDAVTVPDTGKTSGMGIEVDVAVGTKLLAPQSETEQTELKNNLGDAFNSDTQKKQLLEELKKPLDAEDDADQIAAAKGTVEVFNATLDEMKADLVGSSDLGNTLEKLKLPAIDGDNLTQGDMLALQLMTDLISNTVAILKEIGGVGGLGGVDATALENSANKAKVLSIIDDALFAAEVAEQISGAASIDFTGQIDLGSLLEGLGSKGTQSRVAPIALTDAEDFLGTINDLAPTIVELMGITYDGTNFVYTAAKYKSFLLNQQIYRSSMEQALKMMELGKLGKDDIDSLSFDTSTLVKYVLSVFITEHEAFCQDERTNYSATTTANEIIVHYLNFTDMNKKIGLGTLVATDSLTQPSALGNLDYARWPTFLKNNPVDYYKTIIDNIIRINDAGGIAQLSTELIKFRDAASTEDGLTKWYNEL